MPERMRPTLRTAPNTVAPKVLPRRAGEEVGGGDAAALRPVDDLLDQHDRGAARKPHAEADDRASRRRRRMAGSRASGRRRPARRAGSAPRRPAAPAQTPKRAQMRGESVAPIGQPSTIAESAKPATSGGFRITPWTKTGRKVVSPMITMPANSDEALTAAIGLRPQSSSEIIGSGERRSWTTNAATAATATRGDDARSRSGPRSKARSGPPSPRRWRW